MSASKCIVARQKRARDSFAQRGMSLMELMVGLGIGMVLTLGMFTMIVSTSQSFRVNDDFSHMQENAVTAFRYLSDSVRQAGFYGNQGDLNKISVAPGSAINIVNDCGSAVATPSPNFALDFLTPIHAYTGYTTATVNGAFPCIPATNFYPGPPLPVGQSANTILVTRGASGYRICWNAPIVAPAAPPYCPNVASMLANQPNFATTIYVQSSPYWGYLLHGADYAAWRADARSAKYPNNNDAELYEFRTHIYYIRPCSRPAGGAVNCTGAADDNGAPIPTLVRQELIGDTMTEVPLVEGIELIDYRFGIDNTSPAGGATTDGIADFYSANIVIPAQWQQVVSVKITLLVRSPNVNIEYDDSGKQYDLLGDGISMIYKCTNSPAPACKFKRKVFSQTIQARNIAQRTGG